MSLAIYRKLIMQTGANPDKYRDYQIERKCPILRVMKSETEVWRISAFIRSKLRRGFRLYHKLIWQLKEFLKGRVVPRQCRFSEQYYGFWLLVRKKPLSRCL
ncbi:MAG: hypothetical protein ACLR56_08985 [Oscillospiraceae bacterium]